jgi:hypothetical protein
MILERIIFLKKDGLSCFKRELHLTLYYRKTKEKQEKQEKLTKEDICNGLKFFNQTIVRVERIVEFRLE